MLIRWLAAVMVLVGSAVGQSPGVPDAGPTGIVTGVVTCSDTHGVARFVQVALVLKTQLDEINGRRGGKNDGPSVAVLLRTATGSDGRYSIADVPVGDYFAIAVMKGYRMPVSLATDRLPVDDLATVMTGYPTVHVAANGTTVANVVLKRGAGVSGRVTFKDGSPVVGMWVGMEPTEGVEVHLGSQQFMLVDQMRGGTDGPDRSVATDDRGMYRIAGVAPGRYRVCVSGGRFAGPTKFSASGEMVGFSMGGGYATIYAPGKFRRSEGQVVEIHGDEEDGSVDIRVSFDGTHTVRGVVLAKEDRHPLQPSTITLQDTKDESFSKMTLADEKGEYHFDFLPEGSYTVTVGGAYRVDEAVALDVRLMTMEERRKAFQERVRSYRATQVSVVVGEHDVAAEDILLEEREKKVSAAAKAPDGAVP